MPICLHIFIITSAGGSAIDGPLATWALQIPVAMKIDRAKINDKKCFILPP
jgi:hypothetical protein